MQQRRIRLSVQLVSGYAHVFVQLSAFTVTLSSYTNKWCPDAGPSNYRKQTTNVSYCFKSFHLQNVEFRETNGLRPLQTESLVNFMVRYVYY